TAAASARSSPSRPSVAPSPRDGAFCLSLRLGRDYSAGDRGPAMHRWNHVNYSIPPDRMPLVEACIDAVFPWEKFVAKPYLLGYRFSEDLNEGALYFRPVPEAGVLADALRRLRATDPELERALGRLETIDADWADHAGFMVRSVAEWEERLGTATRLAQERPELELRVVDVL